jgi:guanine nucleotide-binding protein G(i) subunit alpha
VRQICEPLTSDHAKGLANAPFRLIPINICDNFARTITPKAKMADPLSIIGTAGAIANVIDVLTKTITTVCDMRQAWKVADLSVFAFENQLNLLKFALCEIQKWTESRSNERSHQLVMQVDSCMTCCRLLIGKLDGQVSQFQKTTAGDLEFGSKLSFLFKTKDMEQIQRMVDQQTHTLTLLLSACNS